MSGTGSQLAGSSTKKMLRRLRIPTDWDLSRTFASFQNIAASESRTSFLKQSSRTLLRLGITRVRLGVPAANRSAKLAYERAGFQPYEMIYEKPIGRRDIFVLRA
jgi:hypothetical protein